MTKLNSHKLITAALVLVSACWVNGCSLLAPQEDKSRYFILSSSISHAGDTIKSGNPPFTVGLEPVVIPHYLERPEILTRVSPSELSASSTDRWGEPLNVGVARVLAEDLSARLGSAQVVSFPWSKKITVDYVVSVELVNLEKTADGKATTNATWIIRRGADGTLLERGTTVADRPAGADQTSASAAVSAGIGEVATAIARALEAKHSAS